MLMRPWYDFDSPQLRLTAGDGMQDAEGREPVVDVGADASSST